MPTKLRRSGSRRARAAGLGHQAADGAMGEGEAVDLLDDLAGVAAAEVGTGGGRPGGP